MVCSISIMLQRFRSRTSAAQAYLNIRSLHMSKGTFSCKMFHLISCIYSIMQDYQWGQVPCQSREVW